MVQPWRDCLQPNAAPSVTSSEPKQPSDNHENIHPIRRRADQRHRAGRSRTKRPREAGAISGDLTDGGATDQLRFGPKPRPGPDGKLPPGPPPPKNAKADVKFILKDGALVRYVVHAKGVITFGGNENEFERIATIELKDVGTTKLEVPEAAKKKLGQ